MAEACTKCGVEERQGSHPWGKRCRAEYRKRGKEATVTPVITPVTVTDGNAVTPVSRFDGPRHEQDVKVFEEQIAGLKETVKGLNNTVAKLTTEAQRDEEGRFERSSAGLRTRGVENMPAPKKGLGGVYTPHGVNCACIACRAGRQAEMEPA